MITRNGFRLLNQNEKNRPQMDLSVVSMEGFDWRASIDMQRSARKWIRNSGKTDTSAISFNGVILVTLLDFI